MSDDGDGPVPLTGKTWSDAARRSLDYLPPAGTGPDGGEPYPPDEHRRRIEAGRVKREVYPRGDHTAAPGIPNDDVLPGLTGTGFSTPREREWQQYLTGRDATNLAQNTPAPKPHSAQEPDVMPGSKGGGRGK